MTFETGVTYPVTEELKQAWRGFEGRKWREDVNVREFIQSNYTMYDGDESFLAPPTEATKTTTSSDPKGGTVTVSVDQLNVRDAAGTSGKRLVVVKRDQTFTYSKSQKVEGVDWYYIKVNNSISGWVMGTYVKVSPNSPTTTEATTAATQSDNTSDSGGGKLTVTADALNVRRATRRPRAPSPSRRKSFR